MSNIKIIRGVFDTKLELQHAGVNAGFPSPAEDYIHEPLDFNRDYIRHPEASFYGDIEGDSMKDAGIFDGDRVIIDRAVEPHNGSIVVSIKKGTPYFQLAQQFPNQKIAVFSSNYELYGELTGRVVSIISKETPAYFRYSIDECFMYLDKLQQWGERLHRRVKRELGMSISIGLAPNKTLSKIALKLAKKKSICTSRSFNGMISDYDTLRTHVSNYAARCAEKLRQQYTRKDGKGKADVFANAIKHDFKSKNPTTRWSDIIKLK